MATAVTTIVITHGKETLQTAKDKLMTSASKPRRECLKISNYFDAVSIGTRQASFTVAVDAGTAVAGTGTVTLSSFAAADTVTVGSQTFTASASPSGANQFLSTGGDTAVAAALAVKINAHASLAGVVTALAASGVVTVTAAVKGLIGNSIGIAISAHGSVSGALLTGGVNAAAANTYHCGV